MDERPDWDHSETNDKLDATEGVRLIAADEAAEAVERGEVAPRRGGDLPRYGDRPSSPDDGPRPTLRFPLGREESSLDLVRPRVSAPSPVAAQEGPRAVRRWSTSDPGPELTEQDDPEILDPGRASDPDELGDEIDLREPGERGARVERVHVIAADDDDDGWSSQSIAAPRWRNQLLDLDDADLEDAPMLQDEETNVKSLDEPDEPQVADVDPDVDPAADPAADVDATLFPVDDDRTTVGGVSVRGATPDRLPTEAGSDPTEPTDPPTEPVVAVSASAKDVGAVSARQGGVDGQPTVGEHGGGAKEVPPRDVRLAVVSGLGLAVAALALFMLGEAAATVLVTVIAVVCSAELFSALRKSGYQPATLLGLVATGGLVAAAYWRGEAAIPIVLGLTVVVALLWYLVGVTRLEPTMNAGVSMLAVVYVGLLASFATLLLRNPNGRGLLGGVIIAVVANDVCALVVGRKFGRRLVAPLVSPAKTVEGLVGGGVASVAVSVLLIGSDVGPLGMHPWDLGSALLLGVVVAVMAPLGDLCESMMKRDLGIKDMSAIIPGHGGVLDRVDALLFCLPAVYYLTVILDLA